MKSNTIRRFRHVGGFGDETDYVEAMPNGEVFSVRRDGSVSRLHYLTLVDCLDNVIQGFWKEFSFEQIRRPDERDAKIAALTAALRETNTFAEELMTRAAALDRQLRFHWGSTKFYELGEIIRMRKQIGKNRVLFLDNK
jgi:hypothetical protein